MQASSDSHGLHIAGRELIDQKDALEHEQTKELQKKAPKENSSMTWVPGKIIQSLHLNYLLKL